MSLMDLGRILEQLPQPDDENLLVGTNTADDAGVYKISEDQALIQTVDFFTPIVDDPYMFGQIAAANALSDVYAMGGTPLTALNIVGFSTGVLEPEILTEILKGGYDKIKESGALIVGGHTATDEELKYGLSITGTVHPDKVVTNTGAKVGDKLILTKPIGTGIISTALKNGKDLGKLTQLVSETMATLNKTASAVMQQVGVNACTDITGFGLMGHASEMAAGANLGILIFASKVPIFNEALQLVDEGFVPGGTRSNEYFLEDKVRFETALPDNLKTLLFDAQTSGGLLISVAAEKEQLLVSELKKQGVQTVEVIGELEAQHPCKITVI